MTTNILILAASWCVLGHVAALGWTGVRRLGLREAAAEAVRVTRP
jgi:hypothetical protein